MNPTPIKGLHELIIKLETTRNEFLARFADRRGPEPADEADEGSESKREQAVDPVSLMKRQKLLESALDDISQKMQKLEDSRARLAKSIGGIRSKLAVVKRGFPRDKLVWEAAETGLESLVTMLGGQSTNHTLNDDDEDIEGPASSYRLIDRKEYESSLTASIKASASYSDVSKAAKELLTNELNGHRTTIESLSLSVYGNENGEDFTKIQCVVSALEDLGLVSPSSSASIGKLGALELTKSAKMTLL